jgi:TRAP transporter TAXI family solute receptor
MKTTRVTMCLLIAVFLLFTALNSASAKPKTLSQAATGIKSNVYVFGTAFGRVIEKYTGIKVIVEETPGILYWGPLMKTGEMDLGMTNAADVVQAYRGVKKYFKEKIPVRAISHGSTSPVLFWSTNPNIKSINDLKGRKIGMVVGTMSHDLSLGPLFKVYGMTVGKDVELIAYPSSGEMHSAFKSGKLEVMYWAVAPWYLEYKATLPGLHAIPIPREKAKEANVPGMPPYPWKKGLYGIQNDIPGIGIVFGWWVRSNLEESVVYEITKAVYDHYGEYKDVHPSLKSWTLEAAVDPAPMAVPFHPGAIKYYKEKGVWSTELEKLQENLLAK